MVKGYAARDVPFMVINEDGIFIVSCTIEGGVKKLIVTYVEQK